ncbi:uncharacterized protein LOC142230374 [Haematobia irritans]|uniref:uncharacterized protein LOC142230374 n=1 Tax=Haematobia irritans TaxID=7368 RepID=UPI003F4F79E1
MFLQIETAIFISFAISLITSNQFIPYSKSCQQFKQSQQSPIPRCRTNNWISWNYIYRYSCNDNGNIELCNCQNCFNNQEYPNCDDLFCISNGQEITEDTTMIFSIDSET